MTTSPADPTPTPDPTPNPEPAPRRLTRSSTDRMIGGVAGGLGRHLGIDPILVRVGFVVLTFAGGAGILAYLALLAFVPADDGTPLGAPPNRTATVLGSVALIVAALVILGPPAIVLGPGLLVLALLGVAAVLIVRAAGGTEDPARTAARAALLVLALLAAVSAAVGVAIAAALGGGVVIAALTIVAGLALVGAALMGGARWLIVPALVLALPLALVAAADIDVDGGIGDREYHPRSASQLSAGYELGAGELVVDARSVDLPAGRTVLPVEVGIGQATVLVPEDVCVTSDVEIGAGAASVFDRVNDGVDVAFAEGGTPAAGEPELHVDARIGAGRLVVHRGGGFVTSGRFGPVWGPLEEPGC